MQVRVPHLKRTIEYVLVNVQRCQAPSNATFNIMNTPQFYNPNPLHSDTATAYLQLYKNAGTQMYQHRQQRIGNNSAVAQTPELNWQCQHQQQQWQQLIQMLQVHYRINIHRTALQEWQHCLLSNASVSYCLSVPNHISDISLSNCPRGSTISNGTTCRGKAGMFEFNCFQLVWQVGLNEDGFFGWRGHSTLLLLYNFFTFWIGPIQIIKVV